MPDKFQQLRSKYADDPDAPLISVWQKRWAESSTFVKLGKNKDIKFFLETLRGQVRIAEEKLKKDREATDLDRAKMFQTIDNFSFIIDLFDSAPEKVKQINQRVDTALSEED